ncbi:MAG: glycosyltransferase family 4 protein [Myxococcota bacterium]
MEDAPRMSEPLVIHLLPYDLARGAQTYARALCDALDGHGARHRVATLFEPVDNVLGSDFSLNSPHGVGRRLGFDPRAAIRLRRLLHRTAPRAVVAHGSEPLKYALAARPARLPVFAYRIGVSAVEHGLRRRLLSMQFHASDLVAGVSHEVLDETVNTFGVPRERCRLVPNGRDPRVYHPPSSPTPGPPRIVFVGHFDDNKRPELVIECVERLARRGVSFTATMIGDGPRLEELRPRAEQAGIEVLGRRSDVPDQLRRARVCLLVSKMEGMPGIFIEAGLTGLPVVTTDVPGARTVLVEGQTGFVVGVDAIEALVARLERLLTTPELARSIGEAARKRCVAEFSLEHSASLWMDILRPHLAPR